MKVGGEWKYQPRLVSWYGPCDYSYSGLVMEKNLNWAPELLDLLHRWALKQSRKLLYQDPGSEDLIQFNSDPNPKSVFRYIPVLIIEKLVIPYPLPGHFLVPNTFRRLKKVCTGFFAYRYWLSLKKSSAKKLIFLVFSISC